MIDTALLFAFIDVESSFNAHAFLNDKNGGSYGLLQMDLATAKDRGYAGTSGGLYDPFVNVKFGAAQLDWLTAQLRQRGHYSIEALAASYNEGLVGEERGQGDPAYVNKIVAAYARWKLLFPVDNANVG
jgi:soluble lytic murein transglycosylase-like protein